MKNDNYRGATVSCSGRARWGRRLGWAAATGFGLALAEAAPSALILPALGTRQPSSLGRVCRWRGPADAGAIALTFDDGPDVDTLRTLDVLDHFGLRATFFLLGAQIAAHPGVTCEIAARGHEVGTHGFDHRHHLLSAPWAIGRDLDRAIATHHQVLGSAPRFFRPPYGQLALASLWAARRHGLETVLWSASAREWTTAAMETAFERLAPGLRPGAIVLLHDNDVSCPPGTGALTRSLLEPLARSIAERGLRGTSVGELVDHGRAGDGASIDAGQGRTAA